MSGGRRSGKVDNFIFVVKVEIERGHEGVLGLWCLIFYVLNDFIFITSLCCLIMFIILISCELLLLLFAFSYDAEDITHHILDIILSL